MFEPVQGRDQPENQFSEDWELHRAWKIFFEDLCSKMTRAAQRGPFIRTLLLKDTTVGVSIADHLDVFVDGVGIRIVGVLRKVLTADLTADLYVLKIEDVGSGFQLLQSCTIPQATAVNTPIDFTSFTSNALRQMKKGDVLRWDVTASDGQADKYGVAAFTFVWQPSASMA